MTTVCFLSDDLSVLWGPIDGFLSLVWEESYTAWGSYTLCLPYTRELFAVARSATYVSVSDRRGLGRVEKIRVQTDGDGMGDVRPGGNTVYRAGFTVSGRMAESLLSERVIPRGTRVEGDLVSAVETLVSENACAEAGAERAIPHLVRGQSRALSDENGVPYTVSGTPGGRALDDWLRAALEPAGASFRILPDYDAGTLVFSVFRGLDRTQGQTTNPPCVFSTSFSSVGALEYVSDIGEYKNFAYIAGEGEGSARVTVTLDLRTDPEEMRRELFVDARDLRSDDGESVMSDTAYRNLLLARGRERLQAHRKILQIEGETAAAPVSEADAVPSHDTLPPIGYTCTQPFRADIDYALGDLCDIASETLGMTWSERISSIVYTYEGTQCMASARFGGSYPDLRAYIRRCVSDGAC